MSRFLLFLSVFFIFFQISGYAVCLNEEKVSEQCIKEVYKSGDLKDVLKNADQSVFKNSAEKSAIIIDTLYKTGRYDELEKVIKALPQNLKNSLYYRIILLKSHFAGKRFNQTVEMLDSIKEAFPVYYISSGLECLKGDIFLYKKQYDSALEVYDRCGVDKITVFSSYNRILALEKNGVPKNSLIKDYIEFAEKFQGSELVDKIIERLVFLKEKNNFPSFSSPHFYRWFMVMKKTSNFDRFFNDDFLKLSSPVSFEVIKYLILKNRYSDALTIIETELQKNEKDVENKYQLATEKYKLLLLLNKPKLSAEYLLSAAQQFPDIKKDKMEFYAGLIYFDSGYVEEGRVVLEKIVLNNQKSKYFLMALYKLGLIYLSEGSQLYTFTLWSNYIFDSSFSASKYLGGQNLFNDMTELATMIDRLNNFCLISSDAGYECNADETCAPNLNSQFITYYDFAYFSLIKTNELQKKLDHRDKGFVEKWKKNRIELSIGEAAVLEKIAVLPKKIRNNENVVMIEHFLNAGVKNGVVFYLNGINTMLRFEGKPSEIVKLPPQDILDARNAELAEFKTRTSDFFIRYLGKTGDIADSNYRDVSENLSYSPHYGKKNEWKLIYPTPYFDDIMKLSLEFDVPPQLIYSIMRAETFYRDNLVSPVGALGLMQVMPDTFQKISKYSGIKINDPFNAYESMKASAWYLSKLLKRFDGSYIAAIAAYNAGPHRVTEWIVKFKGMDNYLFVEMIPYAETRNYVKKVLRYFLIYSYLYEESYYDVGLNGVVDIEEQPDIVNF